MVYHMTIGIITDDIIHSVVVKMSTNGWLSIYISSTILCHRPPAARQRAGLPFRDDMKPHRGECGHRR